MPNVPYQRLRARCARSNVYRARNTHKYYAAKIRREKEFSRRGEAPSRSTLARLARNARAIDVKFRR